MSIESLWFFGWSALLAAMLFVPVTRLVWALSVRRLERKLGRKLEEKEIAGQLTRARLITFLLVVPFALMFNANVFGVPDFK